MKKYAIEFVIDNREQYLGEEPHSDIFISDAIPDYTEASNENEAISLAIDYLVQDTIQSSNYYPVPDYNEQTITVYEDDSCEYVIEHDYRFIAREVEDYE